MYDVIIVGAGPAGISASLYTQRAGNKTLNIYQIDSSLSEAKKIENYYGFENGVTGKELYEKGINQAKGLGVVLVNEEVLKIDIEKNRFYVTTNKNTYGAKSIIIAIGTKKNRINLKGLKELEGRGVSYCAICDGFFYKNKNVAVIGSGDYALSETNELINIAKKVTILTNGKNAPDFRADNVEIVTKPVEEILGENKVREVRFKDNTTMLTDGIFVAEGTAGSMELAKKLGLITRDDKIVVNEFMQTNIEGIYACGDCTGGLLQISKAVYEGMIAGIEVNKYLKTIN